MNSEQKGYAADRILKDPLIKEVIEEMRADCFAAIEKSTFYQKKNREEAYKMLRTISTFENKFRKLVEYGKLEKLKKEKTNPKPKLNKLW